ncbi:hypothetical protein PybrP1_004746 [[Pythium] brassicae (nom. inval.)]|nr:hypothetical protein PybrP1_004746 [[Pythium] brassicae (nom. inval.)]
MASTPNDGSGTPRIDFLRAESAIVLDVDMSDTKVEQHPQHEQRQPPNSRRDYVARRMQLWEGNSDAVSGVEMGAISRLPLPLQVAFRCKMLTIFALQLLLVLALVGLCAFYSPVNDVVATAFQLKLGYLIAAAIALVVLLVVLYVIRALFPLNWLVLLLFTGAQAALFAALGVKFDTYLGVFNCGASFCCVVVMLLLAGVRRREPGEPPKLISSVVAGLIAYVVVALAACALYVVFGREFVTPEGFAASLAFQFALILWFALDAASMYRVMSPDEYMHGVIYFYTDMILLVVVCVAAVGAVAACVALATGDGNCDGNCDCGDCGGCCGGGGGACTWTDCCNACSSCCNVWLWWPSCTSSSRSSDCSCCSSCERKRVRTAYRDVDKQPVQAAPPPSASEWDEAPQKSTSAGAVREQQIQRV